VGFRQLVAEAKILLGWREEGCGCVSAREIGQGEIGERWLQGRESKREKERNNQGDKDVCAQLTAFFLSFARFAGFIICDT
jgi:hypothetical protein